MKKNLLPVICYLLSATCNLQPAFAAIPTDYYASIDGKTGDAIWSALYDRIESHTDVGYDGLWEVYDDADVYPGTTKTWDIYSTCDYETSKKQCGNYSKVCDCQNREHTVPQSWWSGSGMKSDAFHVLPTDGKVNGQRSNYPYGECKNGESLGDKALGKLGASTFSGYSGKVFEPDDEYKGDIARNYFYMITCYMKQSFTQSTEGKVMFTKENDHAAFTAYSLALLLKWHRQDPVSQKEIDRNNAVYKHQKNRNPYIDYPCLAEYIWGEHKGEKLVLADILPSDSENFKVGEDAGCNCSTDQPTIQSPKQSATVAVGSASVNESVSKTILVLGVNLTKSLSLSLTGAEAAYFSLDKTTISAADALEGCNVTVTYQPEATGNHSATLTIASEEITKSDRTVTLTGESKAELVEPAVGTEFRLNTEGVGDAVTAKIYVKGTNLTKDVNIGLISGSSSSFAISPKSLTADQVKAGDTITVTYKPTAIGEESTKIYINQSNPSEFSQRFITLNASCSFALKEPTDITSSSATLHWTKTEKNSYMVDVFFLKQIEEKEVVILDDAAGANATKVQYYDTSTKGYIRLGSSSKGGSISYGGLDLSKGGKVVITAKAYNSTDNPSMIVTINGDNDTIALATTDTDYSFDVADGASTSSSVKIASPKANQRIYIKNVKATTGGIKEEREHVQGYPREEIYLFHTVSGLLPNTEYSYTVTPDGLPESEIATFSTAESPTDLPATPYPLPTTHYTKMIKGDRLFLQHNGQLYNVLGAPINP